MGADPMQRLALLRTAEGAEGTDERDTQGLASKVRCIHFNTYSYKLINQQPYNQ